ncbi:MAG: hypothetical protein ACI9KE_006720 [Polyangiales bacterium]|jgi:hypothetical protein
MTRLSLQHLTPLFLCVVFQGCFNSGRGDTPADAAVPDAIRFDSVSFPDVTFAPDAGESLDAGFPGECTADDANAVDCPTFICDQPARWHWNGHSCFPVECGACEGADCDSGPFEREECEAAHRTCSSTLCRESEGTWRFWGIGDCGFDCGLPSGDDCAAGPTCDCGAFATFVEGRGCVEMESCIGPPIFISPEEYCEMSGGEWGGFCAHSHCGQRSPLACAQPACDCPWPQVFDEGRGCVDGEACFRGDGGCNERSICGQGMACIDGACEFTACPLDG